LFEYSVDMVISSCCSYYQQQLCIGPRCVVFGEVNSGQLIYAKWRKFLYKGLQNTKDHIMVDCARWRHK